MIAFFSFFDCLSRSQQAKSERDLRCRTMSPSCRCVLRALGEVGEITQWEKNHIQKKKIGLDNSFVTATASLSKMFRVNSCVDEGRKTLCFDATYPRGDGYNFDAAPLVPLAPLAACWRAFFVSSCMYIKKLNSLALSPVAYTKLEEIQTAKMATRYALGTRTKT